MKAVAYASGAATLLFMMGLFAYSTVTQSPLPSGGAARFVIIAIVAFGAALASGFLGGDAAAKGSIPLKYATEHPFTFSLTGGVAVFVIVFSLANFLYPAEDDVVPEVRITSDPIAGVYADEAVTLSAVVDDGRPGDTVAWHATAGRVDPREGATTTFIATGLAANTAVTVSADLVSGSAIPDRVDFNVRAGPRMPEHELGEIVARFDPAQHLHVVFDDAHLRRLVVPERTAPSPQAYFAGVCRESACLVCTPDADELLRRQADPDTPKVERLVLAAGGNGRLEPVAEGSEALRCVQ